MTRWIKGIFVQRLFKSAVQVFSELLLVFASCKAYFFVMFHSNCDRVCAVWSKQGNSKYVGIFIIFITLFKFITVSKKKIELLRLAFLSNIISSKFSNKDLRNLKWPVMFNHSQVRMLFYFLNLFCNWLSQVAGKYARSH